MAKITFGTANGRKLNKHDVSIFSNGTLPINGRCVSGCLPATRGDKFHINYAQESILSPLIAPTFGSFNVKTMAFFVPAHTIWRGYRSWVSNSADTSVPNSPYNFSLEDLCYLLTGSEQPSGGLYDSDYLEYVDGGQVPSLLQLMQAIDNGTQFDIIFYAPINTIGTLEYAGANFTAKGRELWSTLTCLGYNFPSIIRCNQEQDYYTGMNYNIFPLMAYARVCYDWLYPSAYVNQQGFSFLFETSLSSRWSADPVYRRNCIEKMLDCRFNQYDQDFYTSLWSKPNSVGVGSNQGQVGPVGQGFVVNPNSADSTSSSFATPRVVAGDGATIVNSSNNGDSSFGGSNVQNFSSLMLRWLTSVSDYALRNNIGGARFREYMKSHFGYNTSNDICDESLFLKLWSDVVRINRVANQTSGDTNGALGELAGMGSSNGTGALKFEAKEAGFLLFITEIKPNIGYYQGNRPWCRALKDRFQLYTPEFDGVGMEGIPRQAIFESYEKGSDLSKVSVTTMNDAFGFAPRYSERYKVGHDNLFGDFRLRSRNKDLSAWHTFRDVLYGRDNLALDAQFLSVDNQYQRIFRYIGEEQSEGVTYDQDDKVWVKMNFQIDKYSTAKSLGKSLPFFDESGQDTHMNYLGSDVK